MNVNNQVSDVKQILIQNYESLRQSEKKVADYVLAHLDEVIYMSVQELAKTIGTSEATVVRFCQSIGFTGFGELKINIARNLFSPMFNLPPDITDTDGPMTIAYRIVTHNIAAIEATLRGISEEVLTKAIEAIISARKVEFYGVGGSGFVAQSAHYQFLKIGIPATSYTDTYLQRVSAIQLQKNDVAIGISYSGITTDVIKVMEIAGRSGATTMCITSNPKSPLAKECDIVLTAVSRELPVFGVAMAARSGQYQLVDILYAGVIAKRKPETLEILEKTSHEMMNRHILL